MIKKLLILLLCLFAFNADALSPALLGTVSDALVCTKDTGTLVYDNNVEDNTWGLGAATQAAEIVTRRST